MVYIMFMYMPGPASTVGERPPTNPAIRVRFPPETLLLSRRFTQFYARPRFIARAKRRRRHLLEIRKVVFNSLSLYKGERSPENLSYEVSILGSGMTSYIPTTQF